MNAPELLHTARLILRKPRPDDAPRLFASYGQDPEVTRFLLWRPHTSVTDSEAFIQHASETWATGAAFTWFLFIRSNNELAGSIAARPKGNEIEIGYVLARRCWGRGLMLEAITASVDWSFSQLQVKRVFALIDTENVASARVLEKAGFHRQGIREKWSIHPNISDQPRDCYEYVRLSPAQT